MSDTMVSLAVFAGLIGFAVLAVVVSGRSAAPSKPRPTFTIGSRGGDTPMTPQTEVKAEPLTDEEIAAKRQQPMCEPCRDRWDEVLTWITDAAVEIQDNHKFEDCFGGRGVSVMAALSVIDENVERLTLALSEERKKRERLERIIFAHAACSKDDCTVLAALAVTIGAPPNPPITEEGK